VLLPPPLIAANYLLKALGEVTAG